MAAALDTSTPKEKKVMSALPAATDTFGRYVFTGAVASEYLAPQGLFLRDLETPPYKWTSSPAQADKVANAVKAWALDMGATNFCHWFQPIGSSGLRHGLTGQVQLSMLSFKDNKVAAELKGKELLYGETDGSSYLHGGLRATHTAGAYLAIDPSSPIFLRGDTVFIPATFTAYTGDCLDEKTPLLRSNAALANQGARLMNLLGYKVKSVGSFIGLEQEFFLIPRDQYKKRVDLQLAGRTVLGRGAPRGQELCDHYMAPPKGKPLAFFKAVQEECYKLGIPMRTRHREVAPNQYEMAPEFGPVEVQIDQNVMFMQLLEEIAPKYGLACLLQEKPFNGINGSGKHNNWSLGTDDRTNLFNFEQLAERSGSTKIFPIVMAAMVQALDKHGDLLRMAIASPGNDFRLGACEAPPAIITTFLGKQLTEYLQAYMQGSTEPYKPSEAKVQLGGLTLTIPAQDRNRTSPFPYGNNRFEFRAVGSSQNVSMVNTVLNTIVADTFKDFADKIEAGASPRDVAVNALKKHFKVVFNGNGYDPANQERLTKDGVWRIDSGVEAICRLTAPKNMDLFVKMGVMSKRELAARENVELEKYAGVVGIEAGCMLEMLNKHIIPSTVASAAVLEAHGARGKNALKKLVAARDTLDKSLADLHAATEAVTAAKLARVLRLETMEKVRKIVDGIEALTPEAAWTLPTYRDLLFLDQNNT
jgi:glutamine synthetase